MPTTAPTNDDIAALLEQIADLLEQQDENPYRVQAYRTGARRVRAAERPLAEVVQAEGGEALQELPGIGQGLAGVIFEFVQTGRSALLSSLQAAVSPEDLFTQVPGVGRELAHRIVTQLGIKTLEELEQAAHDDRLYLVKGFGSGRVKAVKTSLAGMLSRSERPRQREGSKAEDAPEQPSVALLLAIDTEYRRRAAGGELRKLTPRRFNPENKAWLPIMQADREGWTFTALYSNTKRAHDLGTVYDWVVIYYERRGPEAQSTVVTETQGKLKGKRVVRGREKECLQYYQKVS